MRSSWRTSKSLFREQLAFGVRSPQYPLPSKFTAKRTPTQEVSNSNASAFMHREPALRPIRTAPCTGPRDRSAGTVLLTAICLCVRRPYRDVTLLHQWQLYWSLKGLTSPRNSEDLPLIVPQSSSRSTYSWRLLSQLVFSLPRLVAAHHKNGNYTWHLHLPSPCCKFYDVSFQKARRCEGLPLTTPMRRSYQVRPPMPREDCEVSLA